MTASAGPQTRDIQIDRGPAAPALAEQVFARLRQAILDGRIEPGARLPSWRDLAAQLGVGRGTVQAAYERLSDHGLVVSSGAAGTRAASPKPSPPPALRVQPPCRRWFTGFPGPAWRSKPAFRRRMLFRPVSGLDASAMPRGKTLTAQPAIPTPAACPT